MTFRTQTRISSQSTPSKSRVFFHHSKMEEYRAGMWEELPIEVRDAHVRKAADLMRDPDAFEAACSRATAEWPNSTAVAMTTPSMNLKAWIGHAGSCVATGTPEHLTRQAWRELTEAQQDAANDAAQRAIETWRRNHA